MTAHTRLLTPGTISRRTGVPKSIARPEYVGRADADEGRGSNFYTAEEIETGAGSGSDRCECSGRVGEMIEPGITTDDIDAVAHEFMCDHGAYPSTLGYRGFPKSVCTSVNEVICHGIPDSTVIVDGDIVNVDITAYIEGMHGDTNYTFGAGRGRRDLSAAHRTHL
jgi:methionyl aminopeptidase